MRFQRLVFVLFCVCSLSLSAAAKPAGDDGEAGGGVLCYGPSKGYLIGTPEGWINNQEIASKYGVCAMYTPEGTSFQTTSITIYPQMADISQGTSGSKAIEAQVAGTLKVLGSMPSGGKITARKVETIQTKHGLTFEIWYYDNGAPPNTFEAVAYHAGEDSIFFLVASAQTQVERDNALPVLKNTIENVLTMNVSRQ